MMIVMIMILLYVVLWYCYNHDYHDDYNDRDYHDFYYYDHDYYDDHEYYEGNDDYADPTSDFTNLWCRVCEFGGDDCVHNENVEDTRIPTKYDHDNYQVWSWYPLNMIMINIKYDHDTHQVWSW